MISDKKGSMQHYTQGEAEKTTKRPPPENNGLVNAKQKVIDTKNQIQEHHNRCMEGISNAMSKFTHMTTASMARRPLTHFLSYCGVLLVMILIVTLGGYMELSQLAQVDFEIIEEQDVRNDFALIDAKNQQRESGDFVVDVEFRSEALLPYALFFLYESNGGKLFTSENVRLMCRAESAVFAQLEFPRFCVVDSNEFANGFDTVCQAPTSLSSFFYSNPGTTGDVINTDCPLLEQTVVDDLATQLLGLPQAEQIVNDVNNPTLARSTINLGAPLGEESPPFKNFDEIETKFLGEQAEGGYKLVQEEFKERILALMNADDFDRERFSPPDTTLKAAVHGFHLSFLEFQAVIQSDTLLALGSFGVVTTLVMVYTHSFFFGFVSMIIVVSSIVSGLFLYSVVFQIRYFNNLHILVLFIIMGIGADNIFVLFDAWRQSEVDVMKGIEKDRAEGKFNKKVEKDISLQEIDQGEEHDFHHEIDLEAEKQEILRRRLHYTYTRSILSVAHTATTTFLAFIATSVSDLAPIASFGLYAGFVILMNLVYMTNLLPATLMVYHVYVSTLFVRKKKSSRKKKPQKAVVKKNFGRRMLEKYIYLVNRTHFAKFALAGTISFGIAMTVFALRLETPTSVESNFRKEHMFTVFQDIFQNSFNADNADLLSPVTAVFGIEGLDSSGVKKFSTDPFRGNAIFDDDFDIFLEETQSFIIDFCNELPERECNEEGCSGGKLIFEPSIACWVKDFQEFTNVTFTHFIGGAPTDVSREELIDKLQEFVTESAVGKANGYINDIGIIEGEIKFVTLRYKKTMQEDQPLKVKVPVLGLLSELTDDFRAIAPPGLDTFYQTSFDFVWRHTEEELVSGLYQGMAISLMVSFMVVLAGTRSFIVSSFAITGVATIVMCVLGTIQRMGFELGTAEALAGVMVIGLAVDYTVHLGHMFVHAKHYFLEHDLSDLNSEKGMVEFNSRMLVSMASLRSMSLIIDPHKLIEETKKEREVYNSDLIYFAVDKMGMTVLAGAVTTFLSAVFLLATTLAFFGKMAVLIGLTVLYSTIYAFFFFIPMLRVFGPGKRGHRADVNVDMLNEDGIKHNTV